MILLDGANHRRRCLFGKAALNGGDEHAVALQHRAKIADFPVAHSGQISERMRQFDHALQRPQERIAGCLGDDPVQLEIGQAEALRLIRASSICRNQ